MLISTEGSFLSKYLFVFIKKAINFSFFIFYVSAFGIVMNYYFWKFKKNCKKLNLRNNVEMINAYI